MNNHKEKLNLITKRLYEDKFYVEMFSTALDYCKDLIVHLSDFIVSVGLRGSLVTGEITLEEDIDILINTKKMKEVECYTKKLCKIYDTLLKKNLPQLLRDKIFSVYIPETPANPYERHKLFLKDPVDLEIRTTYAEQLILPLEKEKLIYKFQTNELREIVNMALSNKDEDSIAAMKKAREIAIKKYNIDRDDAHNSTIITQARMIGLWFSKEKIQQNTIIEKRDKIIEEVFGEKITEIKSLLRI
ncbi:MAG: hypothetical protein QXP77_03200 [Candidatus Aenigmatarchaeota archaeon]